MFFKKKSSLPLDNLPRHIGFIMDGNGRWAKKRGLPRKFGHKEGANTFKKIVRYCKDIGIEYITFYAFSTENWKRPNDEVNAIMNLFDDYIDDVRNHIDENVRVIFLGDKTPFSEKLRSKMIALENDSKEFTEMTLLLAINYGGRAEIINGVKSICNEVKNGELYLKEIDEKCISNHLYTKDIPDVDLVIRPSGEQRLSNFLIWQAAYAELYFTKVLWPDFTTAELDKALIDYNFRTRRFGGI